MNKLTLALALGTGLTVGLAAPFAHADALQSQGLDTATTSAAQFNSLFTPIADDPVQSSTFQLQGAPVSGTIQSQVFKGTGAAAGLYAYAYQVGVNNVSSSLGVPVAVNGTSWLFGGTPVDTGTASTAVPGGLGLTSSGMSHVLAYTINDGSVGGLTGPPAGETLQSPAQLNWVHTSSFGSISAQFLDSKSPASGPLGSGANSSTFVVLTDTPPSNGINANIAAPLPTVGGLTQVYAPTGGTISPVPAPEPTTVLAWAGVLGGVALVRRVRKNRAVIA